METQLKEVTLYIAARKYEWDDEFRIAIDTYNAAELSSNINSDNEVIIPLSEVTVSIPVPEVSKDILDTKHIEFLEAEITAVMAAANVRVTAIKEKIQSLQALEHLPCE